MLREWEMMRPQTNTRIVAIEPFGKGLERTLEIAHGDILIHHKALNLVEQRRMRGVHRIGAVNLPGAMMRMGGFCCSITRICTGEVCVRRSIFSVI